VRFLLDTNLVSEVTKEHAEPRVAAWLASVHPNQAYLSVMTVSELRAGAELMPPGARRRRFEEWIADDILNRFRPNILPIDLDVAEVFGRYIAEDRLKGRTTSPVDLLIAATAQAHGLTVVTRNTRDFDHLELSLLNPWSESAAS